MQGQRKVHTKARGSHVNIEQRGIKDQQECKECKKVQHHEIEVSHMSSQFRRIMN